MPRLRDIFTNMVIAIAGSEKLPGHMVKDAKDEVE